MLIRDWISKDFISLNVTDTVQHAMKVSAESHISIMPVFEDEKLVGIVTDRDLKRASPSTEISTDWQEIQYRLSRLEVGEIMSRSPITVPADYTLEETAEVLLEKNISGAPVVDHEGNIIGIITKNDLFKAMISLTGLSKRGVQFGFLLVDSPGSIKDVTDIIRHYNGNLASILSSTKRHLKVTDTST